MLKDYIKVYLSKEFQSTFSSKDSLGGVYYARPLFRPSVDPTMRNGLARLVYVYLHSGGGGFLLEAGECVDPRHTFVGAVCRHGQLDALSEWWSIFLLDVFCPFFLELIAFPSQGWHEVCDLASDYDGLDSDAYELPCVNK